MRAILLAAGLGTRLMPFTRDVPKVLMPIRGVPLLAYWLKALHDAGIGPALINVHHHATVVENYLTRYARPFVFTTVYEPELLNTGGTVIANRSFLSDEPFILLHADNFCLCPMDAFVRAHSARPKHAVMTMMTFRTSDPGSCGIVELDRAGLVIAFHEKVRQPPGDLANAAVYILEPEVVDFLRGLGKTEIDFSNEVIPAFLGRIHTYNNRVYHRDIGTAASLELAQAHPQTDAPWVPAYRLVDPALPLARQIEQLSVLLN